MSKTSKVLQKGATSGAGTGKPLSPDSRALAGVVSPQLSDQELLDRLMARTSHGEDQRARRRESREERQKYDGGLVL